MIDLKNRSRETMTYQYPRDVSAGPVRPQVLTVYRGHLNPKTGERTIRPLQITVGGVLTLQPKASLSNLPDVLLNHEVLQRDIKFRRVSMKQKKTTSASSTAPPETKTKYRRPAARKE